MLSQIGLLSRSVCISRMRSHNETQLQQSSVLCRVRVCYYTCPLRKPTVKFVSLLASKHLTNLV